MTRRDRYALALALECLRNYTHPLDARDAIQDAHTALGLPTFSDGGPSVALDLALSAALRESWADEDGRSARLLRARLALLLRVLLRVDAGDYGALRCDWCGHRFHSPGLLGWRCVLCYEDPERPEERGVCVLDSIRPLWDLAGRGGEAT